MRQGGPIIFRAGNFEWGRAARDLLFGLIVGVPLAVLNVFALQVTQGKPLSWQSPLAALSDALQPGIFEEVIYRFALWGLIWLMLRNSLSDRAVWISGLLAMLIHNYAHFDELFIQSPLTAIGMGLVMAIIWGLPPTILAWRKSMESAIAFHWVQDVARFLTGF